MAIGYFIDIQGTLLSDEDKSPIKGAIDLIDFLNDKKTPYILVTNNTKQKSKELIESLHVKGIALKDERYIDPLMVLKSIVKDKTIVPFGSLEFCTILKSNNFQIVKNKPDTILIASHDGFDAESFATMIDMILDGAKLIGMHGTSTYVKNGKRYPGVGAVLSMLEYATGVKSQIVGKPSELFYTKALEILKKQDSSLGFEDITMISDDAIGDLAGAKDLGISTKLVLSGKCKNKQEAQSVATKIDNIYKNVDEIFKGIV